MPRVNFADVDDNTGFTPIPDGQYKACVEKVEERTTKKGDAMWSVEWRIVEGQYLGRKIFDNLVFSDKGYSRVKLLLKRLGFDVTGELDCQSEMIHGKQALITVYTDSYPDKDGNEKKKNSIPFDGFASLTDGEKVDDDLPY